VKSLRTSFLFILLVASFALPLSAQNIQIESFQGRDVASGEIIVKFRGATPLQSQALAMRDADILSAEPVGQSGAVRLRSRNRDATALVQAYNARFDVLYAEPNYVGHYLDLPNDASLGQQWGIRNTGQVISGVTGTVGADIKATQAWDITEGSRSIVVGVVDSGVDYRHPDLAANMWSAPTAFTVTINGETITCAAGTHGFSSRTRTCDPLDDYGHGTHVAGIIGAAGNNGIGVAGVSRVANMMALKMGALGTFTTMDVIANLAFVMQVKAIFPSEADIRVLNASWGQPFSRALLEEIDLLNTQGILFVAAAGNGATNNDLLPSYPATFDSPNIISVAATDNRDALASFSQWGPTTVGLGAPGVNVFSTMMSGSYGLLSGTSMASPMVAGAAALVLSACPMSTSALKANLLNSADEVPALAQRTLTGGRLNVFRALSACAGSPAPTFTFTVSPGTQNVDVPGLTTLTVTSTALGGFSDAVNLSVSGLPVGMSATFNPPSIPGGSGSSTLTIAVDATVPVGSYAIGITGTSGPIARRTGVTINAGPFATPIGLGQTISGVLLPNRSRPDFYSLTLNSAATVTIDMKSMIFNAFLNLRSASGTILFSNDDIPGSPSARITASLDAGTYLIEATTSPAELDGAGGKYSLSINTPTLSAFTPLLAQPGATINVTLTGTRFISPMTINAGADVAVSNVNVTSPTTATATFTIAAAAVPGPRDLTVTTSDGISNPMMYPIPTRIDPGQKISGSIEATDLVWPHTLFRYSDPYLLTIDSNTQGPITIEVISTTDFDSIVGLFDASGAVISSSTGVINTALSAGTYFMEVTSNVSQQLGGYTLSVNLPGLATIAPRFVEQGASVPVTFIGSRFAAPMTVDAGDNIVAGAVTVTSSTSATATLNVSAAAAPGIRDVTIATPQGTSNAVPLRVFRPIPSINLGETISGTLAPADLPSLNTPFPNVDLHYTDLYRFTLAATTQVTVTLRSTAFDPFLYIVSGPTAGTLASNNDSAADHNSRITTTLAAGTYYLDVTSFLEGGAGDYTISLEPAGIGLTSITPRFGGPGSTFPVTLSGSAFAAPMTINAGPDISVTNVSVVSATSATATFTIAAGATPGVRDVTATTPLGTTAALPFTIYEIQSINLGETRSGTLSIIDRASLSRSGSYGDLYRFVLSTPTTVAIDLKSTDFNAFVYLLSTTGSIMSSDDSSGGGTDARITANLAAGTYFIEATSSTAGLGNYTLSTAFTGPTLYFPRVLAPSDLPLTGFAITNPGGVDANVTFTMYDEAGLAVATSNETIPARAQFAKLAVDIFPAASRPGWVQAKSDAAGVKGFWLGGDWANVMDGAEAASEQPPSVDLVFPIIAPQTELNVVNLGSGASLVSISVYGANGVLLVPSIIRIIPANGALKSSVAAIFPSANLTNAYSLRVNASQRIAATTVASDIPAGPSWIVMNGSNSALTATQVHFPQVVSGLSWNSILWVSSSSSLTLTQTLTLTFTPVTGSPITVTRTLTGIRTSLRESVQTLFGLSSYQEGWVRVTGTAPLAAFLAYGFGTASAVDQGQSTSRTSLIFSHVANGPGWSTGLALLNPSTTTDANVEVYVMRKAGNLVGSASFVLPRGTKVAKHLSEWVPASTANDGFVFVRTTNNVPLFGMQVFFTRDLNVFAGIPASGLDPGITFTPPTQ
jgi:subtilisin family serine protease